MRVFILEDDPGLRFALSEAMTEVGYTVYTAGDIDTALELLGRVAPDLFLLDLMIGEHLSTQIADLAGYRFPKSNVVYITGSRKFPNGELFSLFSNTARVMRKPVDFGELRAVTEHLAHAQYDTAMTAH